MMASRRSEAPSTSYLDSWNGGVHRGIARPVMLGLASMALLSGSFGLWAATAPISSAAVAHGFFVATSSNKAIQHLEGGIIDKILVEEGDLVETGQPLVILDGGQVGSELRRLELRRISLLATMARLDAERAEAETFKLPDDVTRRSSEFPELAEILATQMKQFDARRRRQVNERTILERRIDALGEEITGLTAQKESNEQQLVLLRQELAGSEQLAEKGLTRIPALLQLKRGEAKMIGDIGQLVSEMGRARQKVLETQSEMLSLGSKVEQEIADAYKEARTELDDVTERIKGAEGIKSRLTISSPVAGVVVKRHVHTVRGVITPGQEIMELLPADDRLLVEALVRPQDVDSVHKGLVAEIRLVALNQRTTHTAQGEVIYVSADTIEGKQPGEVYYIARISIPDAELKRIKALDVVPGMPAEVYIKTGSRTFMEYIAKPIMDSMARANREE